MKIVFSIRRGFLWRYYHVKSVIYHIAFFYLVYLIVYPIFQLRWLANQHVILLIDEGSFFEIWFHDIENNFGFQLICMISFFLFFVLSRNLKNCYWIYRTCARINLRTDILLRVVYGPLVFIYGTIDNFMSLTSVSIQLQFV